MCLANFNHGILLSWHCCNAAQSLLEYFQLEIDTVQSKWWLALVVVPWKRHLDDDWGHDPDVGSDRLTTSSIYMNWRSPAYSPSHTLICCCSAHASFYRYLNYQVTFISYFTSALTSAHPSAAFKPIRARWTWIQVVSDVLSEAMYGCPSPAI